MSGSRSRPVIAGITVYRPDAGLLVDLIGSLRRDRLAILVEIDGPTGEAISPELLEHLRGEPDLIVAQASRNRGIGAALNGLVARARALGAERLLLFDQDSAPPPRLAAALAERLTRLTEAGERPAAIGPQPIAPRAAPTRYRAPRYLTMPGRGAREGAEPVRFLITSGTLLDLAACDVVGPFRADYVIDAIDTEWCFRAWARGRSVWLAPDLAMEHRVGHDVVRRGPIAFPRQSPDRMATYLRNQAHGLRLAHVPLGWKLRNLAYLPLQALLYSVDQDRPLATLGRLARAARDGLAGRLGPMPPKGDV